MRDRIKAKHQFNFLRVWESCSVAIAGSLGSPRLLVVCLALVFHHHATAQGTLNALTFSLGLPGPSYAQDGVGWSFVPTSDLLVTGINSSASRVNFWLGTNQVIASYDYAGPPSGLFTGPPTNFQPVASLVLNAGQTYFVSTQFPNFTNVVPLFTYSRNGLGEFPPFATSSYITQFASYLLSSSGEWTSPTTPPDLNTEFLFLGPNFQFQVIPEPTTLVLAALFAVGLTFAKRRMVIMVIFRFPDSETKRHASGFLPGRCAFKDQRNGDTFVRSNLPIRNHIAALP